MTQTHQWSTCSYSIESNFRKYYSEQSIINLSLALEAFLELGVRLELD